jgi:hypothetical protein
MKNIAIVLFIVVFTASAGVREVKKDTCCITVKGKQDTGAKKMNKKRPLYQHIFMI